MQAKAKVKVKICGITNLEDALAAASAGCDALGFIFYKKSPRYITPLEAKKIISGLAKNIIKIGVFVDAAEKEIKRIARFCHLDILQFHGKESLEFCARFKGYKIIKVFRIKVKKDLENVLKYKPFAYLFDTYNVRKIGGTGRRFNWNLMRHLSGLTQPVFLSGGLTEKNVQKAIKAVHPDWVDASSSLEARPGKKDNRKVKGFIQAARGLRMNLTRIYTDKRTDIRG